MKALVRYAAVGAGATALHWGLLVLLVERGGWPPAAAAAGGAVAGAQFAFLGNRRFTFAHRGPWWASWWRFQATAAGGAVLAAALVAGAQALGWHYVVGQALATLLAMLATFAVNRRVAFG